MMGRLRQWARGVKRDVHVLYLAARDPRVPWYVKAAAIAVAAYALSPIDLIPDFIPVIGYLDDVLIVPLGIMLVFKLIPSDLIAQFRTVATDMEGERKLGRLGAVAIVLLWLAGLVVVALWARSWLG